MAKDSKKIDDGFPVDSPYYRFVIKPTKGVVKSLQDTLDSATQSLREGYENLTTSAGKYADNNLQKLREYMDSKEITPSQQIKRQQYEIQNPDAPTGFVNPGDQTVKYEPFIKEISKKGQYGMPVAVPFEKEPVGLETKILIEPDKIISPDQLEKLSEDKIREIVNNLNISDENIKKELLAKFLKKMAQIRKLKSIQAQDRSFLKFMVDEMNKKEQKK
jgi:hypothetical protein